MQSLNTIELRREWRKQRRDLDEQDITYARQLWDAGWRQMAREVLKELAQPTKPEALGWPLNAHKGPTARQMHPAVADALGMSITAPEPVCATAKAIAKPKPTKWGAARFVPIVGFVHENKLEHSQRRRSVIAYYDK